MKNLITATLTILLCALLISAMPTEAEARIYENTLRLHILANSDSDEDQALKLKIRDLILKKYGKSLKSARNTTDAISEAEKLISDIKSDAGKWVCELGYDYSVEVTLTEEWYDTREYDSYTLPRGIYTSLRVIIGEGEGKNWWCVMYPPLCLELACESAPGDDGILNYSDEEIRLITSKKYNVKFKLLELLSDTFAKNG